MTCSILDTKINYNNLDKNITYYYEEHGKAPYLFVNGETFQAMANNLENRDTSRISSFVQIMALYKGNRVYRNDDLAYGEVELR